MSSPVNAGPDVRLSFFPSPGLACAIGLGWTPLALIAWEIANGLAALLLVVLIAALAGLSAIRGGGLAASESPCRFIIRDNRLISHDSHGSVVEWIPGQNCRLFSRLAWLELTTAGQPRQRKRLLVTDLPGLANLPSNDFRQLRVWLRLGASYH